MAHLDLLRAELEDGLVVGLGDGALLGAGHVVVGPAAEAGAPRALLPHQMLLRALPRARHLSWGDSCTHIVCLNRTITVLATLSPKVSNP